MSILVYRPGQLGDAIVALPAMKAIRNQFPHDEVNLLVDSHPGKDYVQSWELLKETSLFDHVISYRPPRLTLSRLIGFSRLAKTIRATRAKTLFYLGPRIRTHWQIFRDRLFFVYICGISDVRGLASGLLDGKGRDGSGKLRRMPSEVNRLLEITGRGLKTGNIGDIEHLFGIPTNESAKRRVQGVICKTLGTIRPPIIAVCPGAKFQAKRWPLEKYRDLIIRLHELIPAAVFFVVGGKEDVGLSVNLNQVCASQVHNVAGELSILESAELLRYCRFYVGNDTGAMHLAAAVGTPCLAIFSSRDWPGAWEPLGPNHRIVRHDVSCSGCLLETCELERTRCLSEISVDEVVSAAIEMYAANENREISR